MVGMIGFEPTTTRTPSVYATRLRYIPTKIILSIMNLLFTIFIKYCQYLFQPGPDNFQFTGIRFLSLRPFL